MTLTVHNQLKLLHDILDEQVAEHSGSISEYQQIKRLVQAMMANNKIENEQLLQRLPEIYHYGLQGEVVQCLTEHIVTNKENIEQWKTAIIETTIAE